MELIQWALQALHGLELSAGAIIGALHRVAAAGQASVEQIRAAIRASPRVDADETGLREDGTNGYLWSFSTERDRYFVRGLRTKAMVDEVLGPDFAGVLVSDCYAAYDHYIGPHQRCWAHLLRDIHDLTDKHPKDAALQVWATAVHGIYAQACRAQQGPAGRRRAAQRRSEADLLARCQPYLDAEVATVPQAVLCRRIHKYLSELFTSFRTRPCPAPITPPSGAWARRLPAQDQWRHPITSGYPHLHQPRHPVRHLACPRTRSAHRVP